jgi:opacity protein-like surface antigen
MRVFWVLSMFVLIIAVPAFADDVFSVKGGYVRPTGDNDLLRLNTRPTTLDRNMLDGLTGEVSYQHFIGDRFGIGANIGYYNSDTNLTELDFQLGDGSTARRDVELRIIPVEFAAEFQPLGHHGAISPFVGGGVGAYLWRYREQGLFISNPGEDVPIFTNGLATTDNTDFGWHVEGGATFPVSHAVSIIGQAKYFSVNADMGGPDSELHDLFNQDHPKVDLSQVTFTGGVAFAF